MDIDLVNKLSNLTFASYYNPSLNMVVVHFFNKGEDKNDVIAYLNHDMTWDVREIVDESAELDVMKSDDFLGESITITHERIGIFEQESKFDRFVRTAINSLLEKQKEEESLEMIDSCVEIILRHNSYDSQALSVSKVNQHLN